MHSAFAAHARVDKYSTMSSTKQNLTSARAASTTAAWLGFRFRVQTAARCSISSRTFLSKGRGGRRQDSSPCGHCTAGATGVSNSCSSASSSSAIQQRHYAHLLEQGQRREKGGQQPVRPLHCRGEGCKQQCKPQCKQQQRDTAAAVAPLE